MFPGLKEFLTAWAAGMVAALVAISFQRAEVGPALHVITSVGAAGAFAIILFSPNTVVMLGLLVALVVAWSFGPRDSFIPSWVFQLYH
jgi:hypothetical protein